VLGRKNYTGAEIDHAKSAVKKQLTVYRALVRAVENETTAEKVHAARADFDGQFFNNLTLALDRYFVHRLRVVTGKDGNPLNEVELIADSLMNNRGVLRGNNVIKYDPGHAVVKLEIGDKIHLTEAQFERLSAAFFTDLERKFR
jgi:hypothetical protein